MTRNLSKPRDLTSLTVTEPTEIRLIDYLTHVLDALARIQQYTGAINESEFKANRLIQDAVLRNLEVLGEACHNIHKTAPEFAERHPDLPLTAAYQMRNAIAHGYFKVDLSIVWRTVTRDLPPLTALFQQALDGLQPL